MAAAGDRDPDLSAGRGLLIAIVPWDPREKGISLTTFNLDPVKMEWRAAAHALGLVGLTDRTTYLPADLSSGQKQRVAVALALVSSPAAVRADEPTAALDKESAAEVVDLLKPMGEARGATTSLVTHDNGILDLADHILALEDGCVAESEERD